MLRRTFWLLLCISLLLPVGAGAQGVPTLTLGTNATVNLLPPGKLVADGKRLSLTILVTDENGGLANGVKFRGSGASIGRLDSDCPQVGAGLYNCSYTTPERRPKGKAELRLRARLPSGSSVEASFNLDLVSDGRARLTLNATPERIVLTQDPSSSLVINVVDPDGNPVDGLSLKASANVGEVQALNRVGPGSYSAVYVPPSTPFPQVATISVWDGNRPNRVFGFFRIPLIGKVNYPVNARGAGVTLIFKVGNTTFPPVVSDATGQASVPITVPPGIRSATVEMIQPDGARSTQKIDLQVPAFNRIAVGGVPDFLPSDGEHKSPVHFFVVDPRGRPADGAELSLTATQGTLGAPKFLGNGLYQSIYTSPGLGTASRATITASLVGEEAASTDSVEVGLEPGGGPARLEMKAEPEVVTPNVNKVKLTARLLDEQGLPAQGAHTVEFRTAEGPIKKPKVVSPGVLSVEVPVKWNIKTRVQAIVGMRGNRQRVAHLVALPLSDQVITGQKVPITVLSLDRYGNPVARVPINVRVLAGGGSVTGSVETDLRGMGTVLYSAGQLSGLATVRFDTEEANYTAPLWQALDPIENFEFPIAGGQSQGRILKHWKKLRAARTFGGTTPTAAAGVADVSNPWGAGTAETATPVVADKGSVGPAGVPTQIEVSALPTSVPKTGGTVNLLVRVVDGAGTLTPGEKVILLADAGMITNKIDNGDGTFSALLTVPPDVPQRSVQVTATRPQGDLASFTAIPIGSDKAERGKKGRRGAARAASSSTPAAEKQSNRDEAEANKGQPESKQQARAKARARARAGGKGAASSARLARRSAQLYLSWVPGGYQYQSTPCISADGNCDTPDESELKDYDFLQTEIQAGTPASFAVGGEWFPFQDYAGIRASYARLSYTTNFEAASGPGDAYCDTHFCDSMNFVNIDFQGRLPLLKNVGPLDILARVGYQFQDLVLFRRLVVPDGTQCGEDVGDGVDADGNPIAASKVPCFQSIGLHGVRLGLGLRFTATPQVRPHLDYDLSLGGMATLLNESFAVPGVTNHHLAVGVSFLPWNGLLLDVSYDLLTRALGLKFFNENETLQRGNLNEQCHTVRVSAGWAF
ncbi:MAG TPA: hypothetical protein DIU15_01425 [Deltaproteobacteria bacterium]|nr:hypothetical protein [Deltaproteobacteria bacterium]HCP44685.1 hypothetical protein [Deltaproteobacteria bacterium]